MLKIMNVHFDNRIPNWRTQPEVLGYNVLVLMLEGRARYDIDGSAIVAEAGELVYIPLGTHRAGSNEAGVPHRKYTALFAIEPGAGTGVPLLDQRRFVRSKIANFQYVERRFERLCEEIRGGGHYRSFIGTGILQELIGVLARELEKPELTPAKVKYAETVKGYLHDHYREPVELGRLAALIRRTPNYTASLFKEVYGQPPIRYMHQLRVFEACNLLLHTDMTVAAIAQHLGYYDTAYFLRMFKKYSGLTPSAFLAQNRGAGRLFL